MRRRVPFTIVVATLALMMALAGGPAALAATKRLPVKSGPNGLSRASGGVTTKIVGGTAVPNGKYMFQAALLAQSFGTNDFERQYCGGSLITPFEVLTAAHCVELVGDEPGQLPISDLRVVVGRTVLTSTQGQKRRVAAISIHPRWDPVTFSSDAVVHLASPINGIRPIMLVTPGVDALERPGTLATVTGWGIGCGATGFPGVYTLLSNRGWELHPLGHRGGAGELHTSRITSPTWASSRQAGRLDAGSPPADADSVSAMWEYAIREYVQEWGEQTEDRSMATFLAELNRLGEDGWEAVGITPRTHYDRGGGPGGWDTFTFVVLLKRLRPADDMMPRS
jgi:hypothetical protein